jgi:hypothetical protein
MRARYFYIGLLSIVLFGGCEGMEKRKIVGKYYLTAIDGNKDNTSLSYEIGDDENSFIDVIEPMVFSVGYDSNFIIAKQRASLSSSSANKNGIDFYIVVLVGRNEFSGNKNVYGPFSEKEFYAKRRELDVPGSLDFSITVK